MRVPRGGRGSRQHQGNCRHDSPAYAGSCAAGSGLQCERGSAVVDFVLVGALLTVFFLAVIQLSLVLYVRNTLIDAAASGARYGALADRGPEDARARTAQLIGVALNPGFAADVATSESTYQGIRTLKVTVRAPLPVIGLIGAGALLEVAGHAAIQP